MRLICSFRHHEIYMQFHIALIHLFKQRKTQIYCVVYVLLNNFSCFITLLFFVCFFSFFVFIGFLWNHSYICFQKMCPLIFQISFVKYGWLCLISIPQHPKDGGRYCFQFVSPQLDGGNPIPSQDRGNPFQVRTGGIPIPGQERGVPNPKSGWGVPPSC